MAVNFTHEAIVNAIRTYGFGTKLFEFDLEEESAKLGEAMKESDIQILFWFINPTTQVISAFLK